MRVFKAGDAVRITCNGRTVPGTVSLASANGWALMLEFEAILAGHVAMMQVLWDEEAGVFLSVVGNVAVMLGETQPEGKEEA
jgi:hypothetical protein